MSLTAHVRRAYDDAGEAWGAGPARVYRALAEPVLAAAGDVRALRALDLGTGSGVLADALVERGADVVGLDLALGMLRREAHRRPPGVLGDVSALPLRDGVFDLVTASFVLNHVQRPVTAIREARRVLRAGGRLLATTFEGDAAHPAKAAVDEVASAFGFEPAEWYLAMKVDVLPVLATQEKLAGAAEAAGLEDVRVTPVPVSVELHPAELVGWRTGMAHLASFVAGLSPQRRAALLTSAESAVRHLTDPVELVVLLLDARA